MTTQRCIVPWLRLPGCCCRSVLPVRRCLVSPNTNLTAREEQIIAAAKAGAAPRFNGARVIGIRPDTPLIHSLAVSGARPLDFSAKKLPAGLTLDPKTGIITGTLTKTGRIHFHRVRQKFRRQGRGQNQNRLRRHPRAHAADGLEQLRRFRRQRRRVRGSGQCAVVAENLQPLGWDTVVVDFRWYDPGRR